MKQKLIQVNNPLDTLTGIFKVLFDLHPNIEWLNSNIST